MYVTKIPSPAGMLYLASDGDAITGLWIEGQKHFPKALKGEGCPELDVFQKAENWLRAYFTRSFPFPPPPPLKPAGAELRQAIWKLLLEIPYGKITTYGTLAQILRERGFAASARTVGSVVGRNPISILIPCHRVIGADGSLTGYAAGLDTKLFLLTLEGADRYLKKFPCPCCGFHTFRLSAMEAVAYVCPVCMWENDVFTHSDDEPSDENHGLSLNQGRTNYRKYGVCDRRLAPYARKPYPEEIPK